MFLKIYRIFCFILYGAVSSIVFQNYFFFSSVNTLLFSHVILLSSGNSVSNERFFFLLMAAFLVFENVCINNLHFMNLLVQMSECFFSLNSSGFRDNFFFDPMHIQIYIIYNIYLYSWIFTDKTAFFSTLCTLFCICFFDGFRFWPLCLYLTI